MESARYLPLLRVLVAHDVEFILIGGLAAVLQGAPIVTGDLDIVHRRTPENVAKLLAALRELEAVYRIDSRRLKPTEAHLSGPGHALLSTKFCDLDVLGTIFADTSYEGLTDDALELELGDLTVQTKKSARYAPLAVSLKVYQYPKCSTCRKALAFLTKRGVEYDTIDIVTKPPSKAELRRALEQSGLPVKKLFNTSGESYRSGRFGERLPKMTEAEALDALAKDGKLIKRPLVFGSDFALVGFDEAAYGARFR